MSDKVSDKAEEYLTRADHCRHMAEDAKTEEVKAGWLNLAEKWMGMAAEHEVRSAQLITMQERAGVRRQG